MVETKTRKANGFAIRNLHDMGVLIAILAPILTVLVATILWGLKLEQELNTERTISAARHDAIHHQVSDIREDIAEIKAQLGEGILPIAVIQITNIERRLRELEEHEDEDH